MYYDEVSSIKEAQQFIVFLKQEEVPCSICINGSTFSFKSVEAKKSFIDGLETFLKTGLSIDGILH